MCTVSGASAVYSTAVCAGVCADSQVTTTEIGEI